MITQGDNKTVYEFEIKDGGSVVNLSAATSVVMTIKSASGLTEKNCQVVDAAKGIARAILDRTDTAEQGTRQYQVTVKFDDDSEFSGGIGTFKVNPKLKK